MGKIVYAAAMSHVLAPDYYGKNVGPHGRKMVEDLIDVVRDMGRTMLAANLAHNLPAGLEPGHSVRAARL